MHPMLNIAVRAARAAGNVIARNLGHADQFSVSEKHKNDLVTDIDRECESTIVSILSKAYREHAILGEEGGLKGDPEAEYQWVIDPIDGTTNFVMGLPHVGVSIALMHKGKPELGVVFDPSLNEMFTAARGEGASLNGRRIRVGNQSSLDAAIVATALPVRYPERLEAYFKFLPRLVLNTADIRRAGAASLDLCYVACGRHDGYLEQGLKPWDFAAGELIVREAGGLVTDFMGTDRYKKTGNVLCGNPYIVKNLLTKVCNVPDLEPILQ